MVAITTQWLEDCLRKRKKSCLVLITAMLLHSSSSRSPSPSLQKPYKRVFWLRSSDLSLELASFCPSGPISYYVKKVSHSDRMLLARAKFMVLSVVILPRRSSSRSGEILITFLRLERALRDSFYTWSTIYTSFTWAGSFLLGWIFL